MAAAGCAIFRLARGCNCRIDRRRIAITRPNIRIVRQTLILHAYTHTERYACIWNVRNKMRGWVGSKLDSGARRMISVCNDRAYRIARFPHHGRPMPILTTRRPTGIPPSGSFAPRDVFPDKGSAFAVCEHVCNTPAADGRAFSTQDRYRAGFTYDRLGNGTLA